jgi:hypothetical protein
VKIVRFHHTPKPPNQGVFGDGGKVPLSNLVNVSHYLRESVSLDAGLELGRGLFASLEVALFEAAVDANSQIVRDLTEEREAITKCKDQSTVRVDLHHWRC